MFESKLVNSVAKQGQKVAQGQKETHGQKVPQG
jgi:hypothetical protein